MTTVFDFVAKEFDGIVDKSGEPYLRHLTTVAAQFPQQSDQYRVALLHDVLEDTSTTYEDLQYMFGYFIAAPVLIISREDGETYMEFIDRICNSGNRVAIEVKIADNKDNQGLLRKRAYNLPSGMQQRYSVALAKLEHALWELDKEEHGNK